MQNRSILPNLSTKAHWIKTKNLSPYTNGYVTSNMIRFIGALKHTTQILINPEVYAIKSTLPNQNIKTDVTHITNSTDDII